MGGYAFAECGGGRQRQRKRQRQETDIQIEESERECEDLVKGDEKKQQPTRAAVAG